MGSYETSTDELRAEAEAMRSEDGEPVGAQWWRDPSRIAYKPMGEVTPWQVEGRLMRALIVDKAERVGHKRMKTNAAALADMKKSLLDLLDSEPSDDWMPPVRPLPQDHADYLTVMGWLTEYSGTWREIAVMRRRVQSPPLSWLQIGDQIDRTPQGAKYIYSKLIAGLAEVANRPPMARLKKLAEVQARNREARA